LSADRISHCHRCDAGTLREWMDYGINNDGNVLVLSYRAKCPECGFEFQHADRVVIPIQLPIR
jgi:ribosomal protein S27AE